jgi:hypothetical protein
MTIKEAASIFRLVSQQRRFAAMLRAPLTRLHQMAARRSFLCPSAAKYSLLILNLSLYWFIDY